ncbi:primase P4-like protein [Candidatus Koribacter versatilis Ellin345]|uniref:Primase P4-like protein n=1 Tax=Koribacter versatilis (strain Ellin345) TaxID=204669 RepID=Q1IK48_KORVE|nr:phage/plasmid primase, P4 family [Candidatus Koribacter versatilis]ABF42752.1 primase P4-like protein [Candidatus Koribacter versatilis Ellin345]
MTPFYGVHEVRVLRESGVAVGYFNSWEAALNAVKSEPSYKGAYFTLNPVKLPTGVPLNPKTLIAAHKTAGDSDIEKRIWLLIDVDPPRAANTNSTVSEKDAAREQAEQVRNYLSSRCWPQPELCDSGNGWHLLYHIELPNDYASTELVRGTLARLHDLFSMVDAGNFNASRLCKLYGTWARKGQHIEERPWRLSAIVSKGSETAVTAQQLGSISSIRLSSHKTPEQADDLNLSRLMEFLDYYGVSVRSKPRSVRDGFRVEIECPWAEEHSGETRRDTTVSFIEGVGNGFHCLHSHCTERHWREFRTELEKRHPGRLFSFGPEAVFGGGSLPLIAHATLAEAFLRDNHDFVCIYDQPKRPIAQWVKTRWDISEDDTLLWRAVADYLKDLHPRYPKPEKGPDSRMRFYDAAFIGGVVRCVKPYLPPVKGELFDRDPHLLGLPNCRLIDLRTNATRDMRREDYITQRIDVAPDPNCPTPRFDRFISEITCGDGPLANYLLRLCALCLTAIPFQALFFLWGRGRNGKGVLIRTLTAILGDGKFAWPLRPGEITVSKFGDEAAKRTFANLKGRRLATVNESVAGNLNTSMLKLISGGDTLTGANMRQDQQAFKPTHKVLLPTNDRPQLPADPAFRGRVHMIPFLANFTGREDTNLDHVLQHVELPGILYRFVTLCPDVIENGLRPPASVLAETEQLFSELDITKQFRDDCLEIVDGAETPAADVERVVNSWVREQSTTGIVVSSSGREGPDDVILRELKHQPDIKYSRLRRKTGETSPHGKGKAWYFVGVRLKEEPPPATPATS